MDMGGSPKIMIGVCPADCGSRELVVVLTYLSVAQSKTPSKRPICRPQGEDDYFSGSRV